jgi:hypothetical protein
MISGFRLEGFTADEEAMIYASIVALQGVGHDTGPIKFLVRADDMPATYRGMCLSDGVALGTEAFRTQAVLNHVLEEELLHLQQKAAGSMEEFGPTTAAELEKEVNEQRKFRLPKE